MAPERQGEGAVVFQKRGCSFLILVTKTNVKSASQMWALFVEFATQGFDGEFRVGQHVDQVKMAAAFLPVVTRLVALIEVEQVPVTGVKNGNEQVRIEQPSFAHALVDLAREFGRVSD